VKPCDCHTQEERSICPTARMAHCPRHCLVCKAAGAELTKEGES
jgi:hypothetical protein